MPQSKEKKSKQEAKPAKLAAVLIRGRINLSPAVRHTLKELNLHRKNSFTVLDDNKVSRGMLRKVNEAVTWGEVSAETVKSLKGKTGLHPPRGGFERKGIKMPYTRGGALGKRDNMDELIGRMK